MPRAASVFLLLGWIAFWLATALQPCCKLSLAAAYSASSSVSQSAAVDHHGNADHHAPASSGNCNDVTIVASAESATAAQAFSGKQPAQTYPACVIQERYTVRRAIHAVAIEFPPLPPPRPRPFHLRTSRLLI